MKTTGFSHTELAHKWVNQTQSTGKSSSMFFDGNEIYSYGRHYMVAKIVKPGVIFFNANKSTATTESKHKTAVSRAISYDLFKVFELPDCGCVYDELKHSANLAHYQLKFKNIIHDALKANKNTEWLYRQAISIIGTVKDYLQIFELRPDNELENFLIKPLTDEQQTAIVSRIAKQSAAAAQRAEKERIEREARNEAIKALIPLWIAGNDFDNEGNRIYMSFLSEAYLRVKGLQVETSHGAKVGIREAQTLYKMIAAGKDIKGHVINGYTVISMNGVLTIGCHKIAREEINRFASSQNW